jgi:hypothetical protein
MSLQDFCIVKYKNRPRDHNRVQQNKDLARKLGKLSIPSFDGSNRSTARVGTKTRHILPTQPYD